MVPLRLTLKGFMSYREEQELSFEEGSLLVLAGPNGAGKSTIFDAITYALYGKARAERGDGVHLINHDSDRLQVRFDFRIDGVEYRIERSLIRSHSRSGEERQPRPLKQVFRRSANGEWSTEAGTYREEDYRRWLGRTLGIEYEAFTTAILLQQGKGEKLLNADPAERREILSELLGLSRFERLFERVDDARGRLKDKKQEDEARLAHLPQVPPEALAEAQAEVETAEQAAQDLRGEAAELAALRVHAQNYADWTRQHAELAQKMEDVQEILRRAEEVRAVLTVAKKRGQMVKSAQVTAECGEVGRAVAW